MELEGGKVPRYDPRLELAPVIGEQDIRAGLVGNHVIGVNEVKPAPLRYPFKYRTLSGRAHPVPAHVGHLKILLHGAEPNDLPPEDPEPIFPRSLLARFEQDLKAETLSQERAARLR